MKKTTILFLIAAIMLLTGCGNSKPYSFMKESDNIDFIPARHTFESIIDEAEVVCTGTLVESERVNNLFGEPDSFRFNYLKYHFKVKEVIYSMYLMDNPNDIYVYVIDYSKYKYDNVVFENDTEYLLPLTLSKDSMSSANDIYILVGQMFLAIDNNKANDNYMGLLKQEIETAKGDNYSVNIDKESLKSYVKELIKEKTQTIYYKERSKETIEEYSINIFEIEIKEKRYELKTSQIHQDWYSFKIKNIIKGDVPTGYDFVLFLPHNFVKRGDVIVVALNAGSRKIFSDNEYFYYLMVNTDLKDILK